MLISCTVTVQLICAFVFAYAKSSSSHDVALIISVTETEVTDGILNIKEPEKHCLWLRRNIKDIEKQDSNFLLSRYIGESG